MAIIKFILFTLIIFYIIRFLMRLILPFFLQKAVHKMQGQFNQQQQQYRQQTRKKPEGSISVDYIPESAKAGNTDKLGDFVEFEEVKDSKS